ncbi:MAG: mitochondrial fission ELM1 family protein [Hyphomicrobiaceae bacterium]
MTRLADGAGRGHQRHFGEDGRRHPLAGLSAWIITDGKIGMDVQCIGVADALGLDYEMKHVTPQGLSRTLAPWAPVARKEGFARPGSAFAPPFPDVAIATGRLSIPYIRALGRHARLATYRIVLQDPKTSARTADLIWVPEHDRRRGVNVVTTLTAPHSFSQARLASLRSDVPPAIAALPSPRIAVILGGPSGAYRYTEAAIARLAAALAGLAAEAGSFLVTPSRRTPREVLAAVEQATRSSPRILWDMTGENPYPQFLAHADWLVVPADSVNMTGEACATGRPVLVFEPDGGSAKFRRFHEALRRYGATRPLAGTVGRLEPWDYQPLDSADVIARAIEERWSRRRHMLG